MTDTRYLLEMAENAALAAGKAIMEVYTSGESGVMMKTGESPIIKAVRYVHTVLTEHPGKTDLPVLSEEEADVVFTKNNPGNISG